MVSDGAPASGTGSTRSAPEAPAGLRPPGDDPSRGSFEFAGRVILDGFAARQAQQIETLQTVLKENDRLRQALVTIRINAMRSTPKTRAALVSFCDMGLREVLAGSTLQEAFRVWDVYQKCSSCGAAAAMLGNGICFECTPEGEWPTSGIEARSDETPQEVRPEGQEPGGDSRDAQVIEISSKDQGNG